MPLSCHAGESHLCSVDLDDGAWNDLRIRNAKERHLQLHCCGSNVVLKKSKLGTQFFAHARRGECTTAPETAEHLFVKARIVQALAESGWDARAEVRGIAPDGSEWIADVLAQKGQRRIAFEVQWSPQTHEVTSERQDRMKNSAVRGLWLFQRSANLQVSHAVPSMLLEVQLDPPAAAVRLPTASMLRMDRYRSRGEAALAEAQSIELSRFVRGCLSGALVWAPGLNKQMPLELHAAPDNCWKCHGITMIVTSLVFRVDLLIPGAQTISLDLSDFDNPVGEICLREAFMQTQLDKSGIGSLKQRFSRTLKSAYLSNGCVHCDALQGAFFNHEVEDDSQPILTLDCRMAEELFKGRGSDESLYWCFDERFEATPEFAETV